MIFAFVFSLFLFVWGLITWGVGDAAHHKFTYKKHLKIAGPFMCIAAGVVFTLTCLGMALVASF